MVNVSLYVPFATLTTSPLLACASALPSVRHGVAAVKHELAPP
jgi:hypothetical protein